MNLHEEANFMREFRIPLKSGVPPISLTFKQSEERINCLKRWLTDCQLEKFYPQLISLGVTDLTHLESFDKHNLEYDGYMEKENFKEQVSQLLESFDFVRYKLSHKPR